MATITAANALAPFYMPDVAIQSFFSGGVTATGTSVTGTLSSGETVTMDGNFGLSGGNVATGTITGITVMDGAEAMAVITGLALDYAFIAGEFPGLDAIAAWNLTFAEADLFNGSDATDYFHAGAGDDTLIGGGSYDLIIAHEGDDILYGNIGDDYLSGDDNVDSDNPNSGNDTIYGGQGNDHTRGEAGDDVCYGNLGIDQVDGHAGNDVLYGGQGDDFMKGGSGSDTLFGNKGADSMDGGEGADHYVFGGDFGNDSIVGYDAVSERIELRGVTVTSIESTGADTLITTNLGGTITLLGVGPTGVEASIVIV